MKLLFDAHLDLSWNAMGWDRDIRVELDELNRSEEHMRDHRGRRLATTTLPEMRRGKVALCQATVLTRCKPGSTPADGSPRMSLDYTTQEQAYAGAMGQLAYYRVLEEQGEVRMLTTASQMQAHLKQWQQADADEQLKLPIGFILAMEGADPIVHPGQAEAWWNIGLRSVNLVHYGTGPYAIGTGEDGPLTPAGRELLKVFQELGMILDVTHLSDTSFFEALDRFDGPVLASHNNCRELVPGVRQFSDAQIRLLIERDAVIGAALDAWMLYPGWVRGETQPEVVSLEAVADHIDHICQLAGNRRHVGIGSDLDGGYGTEQTPGDFKTIADLQNLDGILASRGYSEADINAIFHGNWLRYFSENLPA